MSEAMSRQRWYARKRHLLALGLCLPPMVLGTLVVFQHVRVRTLDADQVTVTRARAEHQQQGAERKQHLANYESLLQRYAQQREQLIREIVEFQKQMDLLNSRTQRLERVGLELQRLERSFDQYRQKEGQFLKHLDRLEGQVKKEGPV